MLKDSGREEQRKSHCNRCEDRVTWDRGDMVAFRPYTTIDGLLYCSECAKIILLKSTVTNVK
jgi:hypothetical protein